MVPTDTHWNRYESLNTAIVEIFFQDGVAGKPVYLDVDSDSLSRVVDRIGEDVATNPDALICEIVRATLDPPISPHGVFGGHTLRVLDWERSGDSTNAPPCIGLLAVFSLVAEQMQQTVEFAGSNYYGRLYQALHIEAEFHERVGRAFRRTTPAFWNALNRWLEESDGRHGLPTAVAFDHRRFIGLPLSQALVRAQDRTKMPAMFARFGLQPGQSISVHAMEELLGEWIPGSQLTPSLKRLWSKPSNREKVSDVVCAELEGWDGTLPDELRAVGQVRDDNLLLGAELRKHPRPAISLLLLVRETSDRSNTPLVLSVDAARAAMVALGHLGHMMKLQPIPGTLWKSVEPSESISYPELLIANICLEARDGSSSYVRRAKRLVLLKRHEADHLFIEVGRAELLETYVIFVVSELAEQIREILQNCARKGWCEFDHRTLSGLPAAWVAFDNVQLERAVPSLDDDLMPLQPIARTHLALGGGLALPGINVWHKSCLPELRIVVDENAESDYVNVRAIPIRFLDGRSVDDIPIVELRGAGVIDLAGIPELTDGDFRIAATTSQPIRNLANAKIRVRSGSWPRPLGNPEDLRVGHALGEGSLLVPFCDRLSNDPESPTVSGALVQNVTDACNELDSTQCRIPPSPGVIFQSVEDEPLVPSDPSAKSTGEELPLCFTRGHHHWLVETRKGNAPVYSVCRDCGREKWWDPPRRKHKRRVDKGNSHVKENIGKTHPHTNLPEIPVRGSIDMDLVLDALSYVRTGSMHNLRTITTPVNDATWFATETAKRFEALGHIQVETDLRSLTPKTWYIAPSTLVEPESGPSFLSGSRSWELVRAVKEVATQELGGDVLTVEQVEGPEVVEIHGLSSDDLTLLVNEVVEYRGHQLELSIHPASRIAACLPTLKGIRALLPELTTSAYRIEYLNLASGRWTPADQMDRAGAYRLRSRPWVYAVVPSESATDQRTVIADARIAEYLAAADASFTLIGYEQPSCTLLVSEGAPLPGLIERAAVLCSGRLPTRRADKTLAYEQVPVAIAEAIWAACNSTSSAAQDTPEIGKV